MSALSPMTLDEIRGLDRADDLAHLREAFRIPAGKVYLDGNSLGALPTRVAERVRRTVEDEWGRDLISSWNTHGWIDLPVHVGEKIAPLLGAGPGQVIACDSISVNLFKLLAFALELRPGRTVVLSQAGNFPTDLYMVQGLQRLLGDGRCRLQSAPVEALDDALGGDTAVLLLTHVDFRSGRIHDMEALTARAHERGALVLWDLAHSAGALPLALDRCHVDLAVGCGYKYLNGGPGAPAFLYVAARHQGLAQQPLTGWMGHAAPFAFDGAYAGASGVLQFLAGTPNILSMAALDAALDVWQGVDLAAVRAKSIALGELCCELVGAHADLAELEMASPVLAAERGSQVAFRHPDAYGLCQALIARDVVTDFRDPDLLRVGFTPLYTRFEDVWRFVEGARHGDARAGEHLDPRFAVRAKVT